MTIPVKDCISSQYVAKTVCHYSEKSKMGKMILNDAGIMIEKWYWELENKYPDKKCWQMVVMPNHFHCVLENTPNGNAHAERNAHVGTFLRECPNDGNERPNYKTNQKYNATVGDAVGWFKTMTTNEYRRGVKTLNWKRFHKRLWQRNYYEHIIRNQQSINALQNILSTTLKIGRRINFIEYFFNKGKALHLK